MHKVHELIYPNEKLYLESIEALNLVNVITNTLQHHHTGISLLRTATISRVFVVTVRERVIHQLIVLSAHFYHLHLSHTSAAIRLQCRVQWPWQSHYGILISQLIPQLC